jgi:hypothetical protein
MGQTHDEGTRNPWGGCVGRSLGATVAGSHAACTGSNWCKGCIGWPKGRRWMTASTLALPRTPGQGRLNSIA